MNPQGADLLAQLRDIHAVPVVAWWPPAPGWWLLAALLLVALWFAARWAVRRYRRRLMRRRWLAKVAELQAACDPARAPQAFIAGLNRILKVTAMGAFPEAHCARLQGAAWVSFLRQKLGDDAVAESLEALAGGPYEPRPQYDADALLHAVRRWIRRYG